MTDDIDTTKVQSLPLSSDAKFAEGQIIGGKYRILSLAGKGGMGSVFRVQQIFLTKDYALKTLDSRSASDSVRRFQNEAKAASALSHSALVQVHDFGLLDDGQPYLVMDFVEGESLADHLKQNGPLDVETAAKLFAQIALGLSYAHANGVVHRDIKPSNIMLVQNARIGDEGSAKVVDFGIAKLTAEGGEIQAVTRTGEIFGSPLYMSPEQCIGAKVDHRTDVYSLGCVLFEALTGAPPHIGQTALLTMMMHKSEEPQTLGEASLGREFPEMMQNIVSKMLQKDPDARYQNLGLAAHDMAAVCSGGESLTNFVAADISAATRKSAAQHSAKQRYSMVVLAITALLCSTATGLSGYLIGLSRSQTASPAVKVPDVQPSPFPPKINRGNDVEGNEIKSQQDEWTAGFTKQKRFSKMFHQPFGEALAIINHPSSPEQILHADELLQNCQNFLESDEAARLEQDDNRNTSKPDQQRLLVAVERAHCALKLRRLKQAAEYADQASKLETKIPPEDKQFVLLQLAELKVQLSHDYLKFGNGLKDAENSREYYKSAMALCKSTLAMYEAKNDTPGISVCNSLIKKLKALNPQH